MAKIHCHSLLSGSSWDAFDGDSPDDDSEAMEVDENNIFYSTEATRLGLEDMPLFGLCPAQEEVCLVICQECERVIKASAFPKHCAVIHKKEPTPVPSPVEVMEAIPTVESLLQSVTKSSPADTAIKIEKLELEDSSVKIEEVPLELNHVPALKKTQSLIANTTAKKNVTEKMNANKKSPRKVIPTREREFDADKHCGVWVTDQQKKCTRSLTCKTHALSLRRAVLGRRKTFDALLAEHKARVNTEKEHNQAAMKVQDAKAVADDSTSVSTETLSSVNTVIRVSWPGKLLPNEDDSTNEGTHKLTEAADSDANEDCLSCVGLSSHHPRPMQMCSFGARRVGQGAFVFNRRQDHLRCTVLAMVEKCLNPSQQRNPSGKSAAAILHRQPVKTIGQSSNNGWNKGVPSLGDKCKSHGVFSSSNKNLNNFLKSPPPPRNKTVKQSNIHSILVDNSSAYQAMSIPRGKQAMTDLPLSHVSSTGKDEVEFLKPDASTQAISDMGNIVASIDANVTGGHPSNIDQNVQRTSASSFHTAVNVSLDSSVSSLLGTKASFTTPFVTTPSGNHYSTVNSIQRSVGNLQDLFTVPQGKSNAASGAGMVVTTSSINKITGSALNCLPNGTVSSPPPNVTTMKGYPVSFVIQNNAGAKSNTTVASMANLSSAGISKGHNLVLNSVNMAHMQQQSHVIAQQPLSPMQHNGHKGKVAIRTNSFPKGSSKSANPQIKVPQSPSPQQSSPGQPSPGQPTPQKTIVVTSSHHGQQNLYLNHQHISNSSLHAQPIVQLKQQVEQQQQQLQQITLQQQLQQQHQLQQQKQINSQYVKQQLAIQPRLAPAPPQPQSFLTQQQLGASQSVVIKSPEQPLKSPPNSLFVTTDSHIQATVVHTPQSNVA